MTVQAQKEVDMARLLVLPFVLLLLAPATLAAGAAPPNAAEPADCAQPLPLVLNVALPLDPEVGLAERRDRLQGALAPLYADFGRCPTSRPLQVNVAVGTDYQVLDWMGTGVVDAAVVSDLGVHLLSRDGVELLELVPPPKERDALTPAWSQRLRSFELTGGQWRERPDAPGDLASFRQWLWSGLATPEIATLTRAQVLARPELCDGRWPEEQARYRIVFPSHLAVPGYLSPVAETGTWLEGRLARRSLGERETLRECYWRAFFDHACFLFDGAEAAGECSVPALGAAGRLIELRSDRARAEGAGAPGSAAAAEGARDRLVIRGAAAQTLFSRAALRPPAGLPADPVMGRLFGEVTPRDREADDAPEPFRSHLQPEPYFGVRTFAFTVDESLRLLRLHQAGSGHSSLALVLPGGGVKAAFQSQVIDALYDGRRLLNYRLAGESGPGEPLAVEYVVGTSGGALLGSFVARLGADGPANLSQILWSLPVAGRPGESQVLSSGDVFGWTDLPRYVSLVVILCVFGLVLAAVSLGRRARLSPDRSGQATPETLPSFRPRLIAVAWTALLAAPILVRLAGGDAAIEHVPEIEGLFYAILVAVALFADQCLILDPAHAGQARVRNRWLPPAALLLVGAGLVLAPFVAGRWLRTAEGATVSFAAAYAVLAVAAVSLLLATARRSPQGAGRRRELVVWLAAFVVASLAAAWAIHALPPVVLAVLDGVPLLFLGLLATPLVVGLLRLGRRRQGRLGAAFGRLADRVNRLPKPGGGLRWIGERLTLPALFFALSFLIMDLCRPSAAVVAEHDLLALGGAASKLGTPLASLMVSVGLLLLVSGWLLRVWERAPHYRFDRTGRFVDAMVFVTVGLAFAVYLVLWLASNVFPDRLSMFELTPEFWLGLVAVAAALAVALVAWRIWGEGRGELSQRLHESLLYLCSRHPNAQLASRRFVRVGVLAVLALGWWNFVVAPGLYGNRYAVDYLLKAEQRFAARNGDGRGGGVPVLTARLLAPANALETDGTRFLLVVPDADPCPQIRQPPGSGAVWYVFHAVSGGGEEATEHREHGSEACTDDLDLAEAADLERLQDFVFASGSPFPIFPAHFVRPYADGPREALVDGGYTNNTPVEAASAAGAAQVLIIQSSNPLARQPASRTGVVGWLQGPLVRNVLRLPGFLFERAQQPDRRSRRDLFVVSLSPLWRADWPFLSDFRRRTVETMQETAERDIRRRIGIVESWGPPVFQASAEVPAAAPAL